MQVQTNIRRLLCLLSLICFAAFPANADILNVPASYQTIQEAINASDDGDSILVDPGTYLENIDYDGKAIAVTSVSGPDMTYIIGSSGPVVSFISGEGVGACLDGFTVTHHGESTWEFGQGIKCVGASPTIRRNIIKDNKYDDIFNSSRYGTGIYLEDSHALVEGNWIHGNYIKVNVYYEAGYGAGIYCTGLSSPIIKNNLIENNTLICFGPAVGSNGAGICIWNAESPLVENNVICNNINKLYGYYIFSQSMGGGLCVTGSDEPRFIGNLIYNNEAIISGDSCQARGGGIYCGTHNDKILFLNNTLYGNIARVTSGTNSSAHGGGFFFNGSGTASIVNTVIWGNRADSGYDHVNGSPVISHCCVEGGWQGDGNISGDPMFVDPENGDFHLLFQSPCRDSGTDRVALGEFDFEGDPRMAYDFVDIGTDEFYPHLYFTGDAIPGGEVEAKIVGWPGTDPVGLFFGSGVMEEPLHHLWGDFWLEAPWILLPLWPMPQDGLLLLPAVLWPELPAPYDLPMQALVGIEPGALTNLGVLEVRE